MSSILKALEKVEESQSTRRDGGPGGFKKRRERRSRWVLPVAVIGGATVAALATFAAMGGFSRSAAPVVEAKAVAKPAPTVVAPLAQPSGAPATPAQQVQQLPQPSQAQEAALPGQGAPDQAAAEPVPPIPPLPAPKAATDAVAKRVIGGATPVVRTKSAARIAPAKAAPAAARSAKAAPGQAARLQPVRQQAVKAPAAQPVRATAQQPARITAQQPAPQQVVAAPVQTGSAAQAPAPAKADKGRSDHLRVTGIAWQKDSASSGAIVNGRMLQQGGTVDGYRVEQILEDKVIFSGAAGKVEIPLGAGE